MAGEHKILISFRMSWFPVRIRFPRKLTSDDKTLVERVFLEANQDKQAASQPIGGQNNTTDFVDVCFLARVSLL